MRGTIFDLSGKVALVTGGSKGLGKAMARGYAECGANVMISSRHQDELAGQVDVHLFHLPDVTEEIIGYLCDGNIVDIELVALDKKQQQVERPFESRKFDRKRVLCHALLRPTEPMDMQRYGKP